MKGLTMKHTGLIDRREFTAQAVLATLTGVVITLSGCGSGGYSSPSSPSGASPATAAAGDQVGAVSDNHGHLAVVTSVQLVAGNAVQLDIRGSADHTHTVTLSIAAIQAIRAGTAVITDSTSATDHLHTVTFNANSPDAPARY